MDAGAIFDLSGRYRYLLWRRWDRERATLAFVMLNPNTADAALDDPTIKRCLGFAKTWGYGALEVTNLFGFRAKTPGMLRRAKDPTGLENDRYLTSSIARADMAVVAWGNAGSLRNRSAEVLDEIGASTRPYCLGLTLAGQPKHPLYLRHDAKPHLLFR